MNISFNEIKVLTEEVIGEGNSKYIFGIYWKEFYTAIIDCEKNLTERTFRKILKECKFKDPNRIGTLSFLCPFLCLRILGRVHKGIFGLFYTGFLLWWYPFYIFTLINSVIDREVSFVLLIGTICLILISLNFMIWCREYNRIELLDTLVKNRRET